ncbi:MAG TPA: glycosyltransferase [Gemmatimonadaceae bacterium]|nr:glycosyltransferase [Gemmatimonadaceae bacterium]
MRILHAIHDFLPRHRAGSEIYACELARAQRSRHDVFIVAAEYDPGAAHGTLRWRVHDGLTVVELVNNWEFRGFSETYSSARVNAQLQHVLDATAPDVLHIHNLLNLSLDLPSLARARGIRVVATLHDYTLVCVSGGQRVHAAEQHVCDSIDADRCSRCFAQSAFARQLAAGRLMRGTPGRAVGRAAAALRALSPRSTEAAAQHLRRVSVDPAQIRRRLAYARHVFDAIDLFVAPSTSLADEFVRLGVAPDRLAVSDYGFVPAARVPTNGRAGGTPIRIGFVGTLVWHKGAHVLLDAARGLTGAFELHLHGDTGMFPPYVAGLREAASGLPATFHGAFDRGAAADAYGALDVLVVPSLWPENSPLVIHEAFMHGVPVVAARIGGIPELVVDGVSGLLYEPFSVQALRAALQRAVDDPSILRRLSDGAPPVKSIAQDAREWDARYTAIVDAPAPGSVAAG